ncbi:MAG: alcohol dehydrogenase catalytic domain-containing protein [Terracoccus sp.]
MRALVYRGPWDIDLEDRPDPVPGPGEVVVAVIATGICGSDIHGYTGENGRRHPGQVMGHETVGRVLTLGPGTDAVHVGELVTINPVLSCDDCEVCRAGSEQSCPNRTVIGVTATISSAFADQIVVRATNLVGLPSGLEPELGALVEPLAVGYHAAVRGGCSEADRVLVLGAGPIGQACVLAARRLEATRVAVTDPNPARRELCGSLGATPLDPTGGNLTKAVAHALGGPATLVIDAVGIQASLTDAMAVSSLGSRIVLVGMGSPRLDVPAYAVSTDERTLIGSFCYSRAHFDDTARWVASTDHDLSRLIEGRVGWDGARQSFEDLGRGVSPSSKVLVFPGGAPVSD